MGENGSESDVYRRQILTYKDGPRVEKVNREYSVDMLNVQAVAIKASARLNLLYYIDKNGTFHWWIHLRIIVLQAQGIDILMNLSDYKFNAGLASHLNGPSKNNTRICDDSRTCRQHDSRGANIMWATGYITHKINYR